MTGKLMSDRYTVQTSLGRRIVTRLRHGSHTHLFLPLGNGMGAWSLCGRFQREGCTDAPVDYGFAFFGLCKSCSRTKLWKTRKIERATKLAKVIFPVNPPIEGCTGERMWVIVHEINKDGSAIGELGNVPVVRTDLTCGEIVTFHTDDIVEICEKAE